MTDRTRQRVGATPNRSKHYSYGIEDVRVVLEAEYGADAVYVGPDYIRARCVHPDHEDDEPSMSVSQKNGRLLVHCFTGCDQNEVWDALHKLMTRRGSNNGDLDPSRECTLAAYAETKKLPVEFLEGLGMRDQKLQKRRVVAIPYSDEVVRYRTALTGDNRFRWRTGSKPTLYGLPALSKMQQEDYVVLVEGESCAQTAWLHDIPALGLPGAASWRDERDAQHLESFERIYVLVEPDKGGDAVIRWLEKSSIRDRVYLLSLDGHKDLSDAYVADPDTFRERFDQAIERAVPWHVFQDQKAKVVEAGAWERCEALAKETRILDLFREDVRRAGVVGEERSACIVYLALTSRCFDRPASVIVKGPSAAGKSWVVEQVLSFFPQSAFYTLSAMSERALVYWEEDLQHRVLVLFEAEALNSDFLSYVLRSLLSEGQVRYVTVESTQDGLQPREIVRPGPTGLIVTTTKVAIHAENETRMLSLTVTDTPEQTREVMRSIARGTDDVDFDRWHALQEWIGARDQVEVVVPYAARLAELIPPVATRLRRDFTTLLTLIRAHALLHQETRERDEQGRIIATVEDYEIVRDLIADVFAQELGVAVSDEITEVVDAVRDLLEARHRAREERTGTSSSLTVAEPGISTMQVARHLGLDEVTAWRRVQAALRSNYLKNLEVRPRVKARLVLGDAQLEQQSVLPNPDELHDQED
jgi:hypothetical protein